MRVGFLQLRHEACFEMLELIAVFKCLLALGIRHRCQFFPGIFSGSNDECRDTTGIGERPDITEFSAFGRIFLVIHGPDEENPFVPVEITEEAKGLAPWINEHIWDLNRMQKEREEIAAEPGEQCTCPYECWYIGYCRGERAKTSEQITIEDL